MSTTYVSEGDAATPAYMNTLLNAAAGEIVNVKAPAYGALGDGAADDTAAINAALAAGAGGAVVFPPGTYVVSGALTISANTTVVGTPGQSIIDGTSYTGAAIFLPVQKDRLHFRGLRFLIDSDTTSSGGIRFEGCQDCSVLDCDFIQVDGSANTSCITIAEKTPTGAEGSARIRIANNYFEASSLPILAQAGSGVDGSEIVIANNIIKFISSSAPGSGLIKLDLGCRNVAVTGNQLDGGGVANAGIQVEEGAYNVSISGNSCNDFVSWGIFAFDGQSGVTVENVSITGNVCDTCGISVGNGASTVMRNIAIIGNTVLNAPLAGIDLDQTTLCLGLTVVGNSIINPTEEGIKVSADGTIIMGNSIRDSTLSGIYVFTGVNTVVSGNVLTDCGATSSVYSIHLRDAQNCVVSGNAMTAAVASRRGEIFVGGAGTGANNLVFGNNIDTDGTHGIDVGTSVTGTWISNNHVEGSSGTAINASTISSQTVRDNSGFVTEANGTVTLSNGNTTVAVTHGLALTPAIHDISVTPIEAWGSATKFWIHTPTSTQFTIEVDQDPTQDVDFAWTASIQ